MSISVIVVSCCFTIGAIGTCYSTIKLLRKKEVNSEVALSDSAPPLLWDEKMEEWKENRFPLRSTPSELAYQLYTIAHEQVSQEPIKEKVEPVHMESFVSYGYPPGSLEQKSYDGSRFLLPVLADFADGVRPFQRVSETSFILRDSMLTFHVSTDEQDLHFRIDMSQEMMGKEDETLLLCHYSYKRGSHTRLIDLMPAKCDTYTRGMLERVCREFDPYRVNVRRDNEWEMFLPAPLLPKDGFWSTFAPSIGVVQRMHFKPTSYGSFQGRLGVHKCSFRLVGSTLFFELTQPFPSLPQRIFKYHHSFALNKGEVIYNKLHECGVPIHEGDLLPMIEIVVQTCLPSASEAVVPDTPFSLPITQEKVKRTPVTPSIAVLDLCLAIDSSHASLVGNKAFPSFPIQVRHLVERLDVDYKSLMESYLSSSGALGKDKEETVLIGLQSILDKLKDLESHIGSLEHKDLLRQVMIIQQR